MYDTSRECKQLAVSFCVFSVLSAPSTVCLHTDHGTIFTGPVVVRLAEWASERERKKLLRACGMYFVRPFLASLGSPLQDSSTVHHLLGEFLRFDRSSAA